MSVLPEVRCRLMVSEVRRGGSPDETVCDSGRQERPVPGDEPHGDDADEEDDYQGSHAETG
jgi:hypothetical protein